MAARTGSPVVRILAFWDTSALVPLCIHQGLTPRAVALYKHYRVVVWWATPVEIASALARLLRMNQIDPRQHAEARALAKVLADSWSVVQPSDRLRATAAELLDRFDLRAADCLQLAAALQWCEDTPHGRIFLTADQRLREAALRSGFDAEQL
jgi:predicted nucleic acid-binding protein